MLYSELSTKGWHLGNGVRVSPREVRVPISGCLLPIQFGTDGDGGFEYREDGSFQVHDIGMLTAFADIDAWCRSALELDCERLFKKKIGTGALASMQVSLVSSEGKLDFRVVSPGPSLWMLSPAGPCRDGFVPSRLDSLEVGSRCWMRALPDHLRMLEKSFFCALRVTDIVALPPPQFFPFTTSMKVLEDGKEDHDVPEI
jgi:hypothetical protein